MQIRPAVASDAQAIESLFTEFVAYLRTIGDQTDYRFGAHQFLEDGFGPDPAFRALVAEDVSGVVGYLIFSKFYDGEYLRSFYMADLYVQSRGRGNGIGKMLIDGLRDVARSEGIARLLWSVHKTNPDAIRFYERLGARRADDTHVMYLDL